MKTVSEIRDIASKDVWRSYTASIPRIGDVVRHDGNPNNSSRVGWIGIVQHVDGSVAQFNINVVWLFYRNPIDRTIVNLGDTYEQNYSTNWVLRNMLMVLSIHKRHPWIQAISQLDLRLPEGFVIPKGLELKQEPSKKERFIIWSPSGNTPPRKVHDCRAVADRVALEMAEKHEKIFYACKLVTKATPTAVVVRKVTTQLREL